VWLPYVAFAALCIWLFRSSLAWPGDNPITRSVNTIESAFENIGRRARLGHRP
jgi:lipopolysaccharide export system permease protein